MMNKVYFYKIAFQIYSLLARITKSNKFLKQKIIFGSMIIAIIAVSSCKTKIPHRCYSPAVIDNEGVNVNTDTSSSNIDLKSVKEIEING